MRIEKRYSSRITAATKMHAKKGYHECECIQIWPEGSELGKST
jgi:hypothetical protein